MMMVSNSWTLQQFLWNIACVYLSAPVVMATKDTWDYVIVGAGPAALQMGYYLQEKGRDYVILERSNVSGSFFLTYPRHDKLISINKRYTGHTNPEFNLRHDWNSLLSNDTKMLFRHFSREFFPNKDAMGRYLQAFAERWKINVKYRTEVVDIQRLDVSNDYPDHVFKLTDHKGAVYHCRTLLLGTGLWKPNMPDIPGLDMTEGYEHISTESLDYEGQSVLVLGHGNAAFETAHAIYGRASLVHVVGRSRVRLAWETHYVGDVRGINNELLDTYQLKSMDGVIEGDLDIVHFVRNKNKISVRLQNLSHAENFALRHSYDRVIRCLGFTFDTSMFNSSTKVKMGNGPLAKFPRLRPDYQSVSTPGMYVIGAASHSLDYRKSAGGFIHGFRYTVRALHHILEWRHHRKQWPSNVLSITTLLPYVVKRINEASGIYQMFGVLCDVIILTDNGTSFMHLAEYPLALLHDLPSVTGHDVGPHIVITLEYGKNYSGPGKDVFHESRATGFPHRAHKSNFLHPVLYFYERVLTDDSWKTKPSGWTLPRPSRLHHVVEDFLTDWSRDHAHVLPLRRFLEHCVQKTLKHRFSEECFLSHLTFQSVPLHCHQYITGLSLSKNMKSMSFVEAVM